MKIDEQRGRIALSALMTWMMQGRQNRWAQCVITGDFRASRQMAHSSSDPDVSTISIFSISCLRNSSLLVSVALASASAVINHTHTRTRTHTQPFNGAPSNVRP